MTRVSFTIARHDLALLKTDPAVGVVLVLVPLLLMGFTEQTFGIVLTADNGTTTSGAQQSVPGMAVMFAFYITTFVG